MLATAALTQKKKQEATFVSALDVRESKFITATGKYELSQRASQTVLSSGSGKPKKLFSVYSLNVVFAEIIIKMTENER